MATPEWRTDSGDAWANAIGLVRVPLFGLARSAAETGDHSLMLDGENGSFVLSLCQTEDESEFRKIQSWAWSSNVNFSFVVRPHTRVVSMLRWDRRDVIQRVSIPDENAARTAFHRAASAKQPTAQQAVRKLLTVFRSLRRSLVSIATPSEIVRVFNAFLIGARAVRENRLLLNEWRRCSSLNQMFDLLQTHHLVDGTVSFRDPPSFLIGEFADIFVEPDRATGCVLDPDLLLRHASGKFFQEAHIELERPVLTQGQLFGVPGGGPESSDPKPDARFTPPSLARLLAEQAIKARGLTSQDNIKGLTVLDPACGSGVFLLEAWRELRSSNFDAQITLLGYDRSPVAREMTSFCISNAVEQSNVVQRLDGRNSLSATAPWDNADIILMNPPFAAWNDLDESGRAEVKAALGIAFHDHADKSLAFVRTAVKSLKPGAVLGCVVPAPMLESHAAYKWRQEVEDDESLSLRLVGCFRGFNYFSGAVVEPAFIVIVRSPSTGPVQVVLADDGFEEVAIRQLRRDPNGDEPSVEGYSVFRVPQSEVRAASWKPRSRVAEEQIRLLAERELPQVKDLFNVHMGIRTGNNKAFIFTSTQLDAIGVPQAERAWFRQAAGNSTIRSGRILPGLFVFYPYTQDGQSAFSDDGSLSAAVPKFYDSVLLPLRTALRSDRLIERALQWWELSRPRLSWQAQTRPKIVSAYFGRRGSFAFDSEGKFVVTQGFGWIFKSPGTHPDISWAYIALLNSRYFQTVLARFCPTLRGGQFDLSMRFVGNAFIPDIANDDRIARDTIAELVEFGRHINTGEFPDLDRLDRAVCRAFGVSFEQWKDDEVA